jgi:hypothetical protein
MLQGAGFGLAIHVDVPLQKRFSNPDDEMPNIPLKVKPVRPTRH